MKKSLKNNKLRASLVFMPIIFIAGILLTFSIILTLTACNGDDKPKEHTGMVRINDTDIPVKGDSYISATDFNNAIAKLEEVITYLEEEEKNNFLNKISEIKIAYNRYPIGGYDGCKYFDISSAASIDDIAYLMANLFEHNDTVRVLDKDIPVTGWNISADDFYEGIRKFEEAFNSLDEETRIEISERLSVLHITWDITSRMNLGGGKISLTLGTKTEISTFVELMDRFDPKYL